MYEIQLQQADLEELQAGGKIYIRQEITSGVVDAIVGKVEIVYIVISPLQE